MRLSDFQSLRAAGQALDTMAELDRALVADPHDPLRWSERGAAWMAAQEYERGIADLRAAASLRPDHPELLYNLATALLTARRAAEAVPLLVRALEVQPSHLRAAANLGVALRTVGRLPSARFILEQVEAACPGDAEVTWNLALVDLMEGAHGEGWRRYEARLRLPGFSRRDVDLPRWTGGPTRRLLVTAEQGLGDSLQFCRFLRDLRQDHRPEVEHLVFAVQAPLVSLLRDQADEVVAIGGPLPEADTTVPLLSLPFTLGLDAGDLPRHVAYLRPRPELVQAWRPRLRGRLRVGLAFQGNPAYPADRERSIPLAAFAPLATLAGVKLFSLQKKHGLDQVAALGPSLGLINLGPELDEGTAPFQDTAAVLSQLDLLITSDSAVAHLAGALGQRVWVALPRVPDWRYGLTGEVYAWYPTMRLFRQEADGDWSGVFRRIAQALRAEVGG